MEHKYELAKSRLAQLEELQFAHQLLICEYEKNNRKIEDSDIKKPVQGEVVQLEKTLSYLDRKLEVLLVDYVQKKEQEKIVSMAEKINSLQSHNQKLIGQVVRYKKGVTDAYTKISKWSNQKRRPDNKYLSTLAQKLNKLFHEGNIEEIQEMASKSEMNALKEAVSAGNIKDVTSILKANPSLANPTTKMDPPVFHCITEKLPSNINANSNQIFDMLLKHTDVNERFGKVRWTPIMFAIHKKNYEAFKKIIVVKDIDVKVQDNNGNDALYYAAICADFKYLLLLCYNKTVDFNNVQVAIQHDIPETNNKLLKQFEAAGVDKKMKKEILDKYLVGSHAKSKIILPNVDEIVKDVEAINKNISTMHKRNKDQEYQPTFHDSPSLMSPYENSETAYTNHDNKEIMAPLGKSLTQSIKFCKNEAEPYIGILSSQLFNWRRFGRLIGMSEKDLDIIKDTYKNIYERVHQCIVDSSFDDQTPTDWNYWRNKLLMFEDGGVIADIIESKYNSELNLENVKNQVHICVHKEKELAILAHNANIEETFAILPFELKKQLAGKLERNEKYDILNNEYKNKCNILKVFDHWLKENNDKGFAIKGYDPKTHLQSLIVDYVYDNLDVRYKDSYILVYSSKHNTIIHIDTDPTVKINTAIRNNRTNIRYLRTLHQDLIGKFLVFVPITLLQTNGNDSQNLCEHCIDLKLIVEKRNLETIDLLEEWWKDIELRIKEIEEVISKPIGMSNISNKILSDINDFMRTLNK